MQKRRSRKVAEESLAEEALQLRKKAEQLPPGFDRERLLREARQAETASNINEWLTSPGLKPPT